jgi:UDP-N-acetylmuramate--alanine ligase
MIERDDQDMKHVHFIGIGGTGISAIALVLLESGIEVSGSDRLTSPLSARVQAAGARVFIGHAPENVLGADLVVRSSAIMDDNPEVQTALAAGIPVLKRVDFLGQLTAGKQTIAIAGTHGKTTTTAMIAWVLTALGLDPSYVVGGVSTNLGANAHAGRGVHFVIEADEYDRMFLGLNPYVSVITNIEYDHPDCYSTPADFYRAFQEFAGRLEAEGKLVVCIDDPGATRLANEEDSRRSVYTYGISNPKAVYQAQNLRLNSLGGTDFQVLRGAAGYDQAFPSVNSNRLEVTLQAAGEHNVNNALAALVVSDVLGLPWQNAAAALAEFRGVGRRFEVRGEASGVTILDDYAHHPTEIRATLAAVRARYAGRRLWVVWQPHTYSRTRALAAGFASAFDKTANDASEYLVVTEIYAAREETPEDGYSAKNIVEQMNQVDVTFIPDLAQVRRFLMDQLRSGDVLLVLSAGDADQVSSQVLSDLRERTKPALAGRN